MVGHFLLLTHPNNTVVASLLLQNAPKREDNPPVSASQHNNVSWIVGGAVLVAVALGFFACKSRDQWRLIEIVKLKHVRSIKSRHPK